VYLFATAPPPLAETSARSGKRMSVAALLEMCAAENALVRQLYTKEVVEPGKKAGLAYAENWRDPAVDAGPLPALFLRETAKSLERRKVRLGLFLGSDFPISRANRFSDSQARAFAQMRRDRKPRHFYMDDVKLHVAMFPDLAIAKACVDCHNEHADSPKKDWRLDDVMGATTFTFPSDSVSLPEALEVLAALRGAVLDAYVAYVDKAKSFSKPPEIGDQWPSSGYVLPSANTFLAEATRRASSSSLEHLLTVR
jgi:hypothetical protein